MIGRASRIQRKRQRERYATRRRLRQKHAARGVLHDAGRNAFVGDAQLARSPGVDGAPGQQHVQRCRCAGQAGQTLDAAPAGHDAQHHFGQAQPRSGLVDDDAIAARERQLHATAQAETAHERECRVRRRRKLVENVPAAANQRGRIVDALELAEFVDVGAGDESVGLARANHQAARRIGCELRQHRAQFLHDRR